MSTPVRFGVTLPQIKRSWDEVQHAATTFDELGYDSLFVCDHLYGVPIPNVPILEAWTELAAGDGLNKPANGFCSFPPDFVTMDGHSPERRNAHLFVAGMEKAYTMGGKTDCGVSDDLYQLDLGTARWTRIVRPTIGEACVRAGGLTCSSYCF